MLVKVILTEYRSHGTIEKLRRFFPKAEIVCEPNGWNATIVLPARQLDLLEMFEQTQVRLNGKPWVTKEVTNGQVND
jgi:hypothetical protein